MELFKKIKNKLGFLALFALLFQLTMPVYQTYIFATDSIEVEAVAEGTEDETSNAGEGLETEAGEDPIEDFNDAEGETLEEVTEEQEILGTIEKSETEEEIVLEEEAELEGEQELEEIQETKPSTEDESSEVLQNEKRDPKLLTEDMLKNMRLTYKDGTEFIEGDLITVEEDLRFELDWALSNDNDYIAGDYLEFKLPKQLTVYSPINGSLGGYGSYTVDMDGNVKFTFNEKVEQESNVNGTFWFDTELKESEITIIEETLELVVNGIVVQKIVVNVKPTGGQAISKNGQPVDGNFNTEEVEWSVIVNTTRDSLKNVVIEDPILKGQELILDSVVLKEVEVDASGKVIKELAQITDFTNNSTIKNINIELGDTNRAYKLVFKTQLLEEDFTEGTTNYKNTAYLKSEGKENAQAGGSISVSRPKSMEKISSAFDKGDRSIEWTVNANFTQQSLNAGDEIIDEFTFTVGKEELDNVFEVKPENITIRQVDKFIGKEVSETSDAKDLFDITVSGNKVTYKLKEATNKAFILKYKTELKDGAYINKDGKITNNIELNGKTSSSSQGVYQQVGKKSNAGINYKDKTINWTITVNADNQDLRNFILTDRFENSGQKLVEGSIKGAPSTATVTLDDDLEGFKIDFGNIKEKYTLTYQTTYIYDFEGKKTPSFKNGVKISYETSDGSDYELSFDNTVKPNKQTMSNGAKNGIVDQTTKEITWQVDVNYNNLKLTDAELIDAIPDNQSLIDDSVKIYETSITNKGGITEGNDVTDQFTVNASENQVDILFNGTTDKSYRIKFKTKDKDGIYNSDEVYTNTAEFVPRADEVHRLTGNVTLPNQGQFIGKTGWHNKEDWTIDWKIDVNKSLSKTSDFTVTDDLGDQTTQILLEDTIKVTKAGSTEELVEGEDYTLTVGDNKLKIYFPGEITEAYVVTYSSYIVAEETVDLTNEAEIQSNDTIKGTTKKTEKVNIKISTGGGTGEGTTGGLVLKKFEAGSNRPLENVSFDLIKKVGNEEIVVRTGVTDASGKIEWNGLKYGDYTLREDVPEGYIGEADQPVNVSAKATDGITTKKVENKRKTGTVKIIKVDATTDAILEDAEFILENQTTKQKYTFKTAADGIISEVLPFGEYTVKEIKAPKGYRINKQINNIFIEIGKNTTITLDNVAYVDVEGQKTWYVDADKKLPDSITVELYADNNKVNQQTVTAKNNWTYSFTDLDKYSRADREINYQIKEQPVDDYIIEKDGYNLTNIQTVDISGLKTWKDENSQSRPKTITINLLANDEKIDDIEVSGEKGWAYNFSRLPKYDIDGDEIVYTIEELDVNGYESIINGFNVTNTRANVISIEGRKTWKDVDPTDRPDSIQVNLMREVKGKADASFAKSLTVTPNSKGDWVYTFDKLDQFNSEGIEYTYIVKEGNIPVGYESTVDGYDIENIRVGETDVFGTKRWKDDKVSDRPAMIEVNLLRNNVVIRTKKVTVATNWNYSFTGLDNYDEDGQYYNYTVREKDVPGYAPEVIGTNITNTRSEKTSIEITKGWLDDHSENRPDSIIVYIYQNDKLFDTVKVKASEDWIYELKEIEAYDGDGQPYDYTIKEKPIDSVEEYETDISGFNITNLRVGETEVVGEKFWNEVDDQYRPDSVTVNLFANGNKVDSVEVSGKTDWKYSFMKLDQYDDQGKEIDYTVEEDEVPAGYETTVDYPNITNTQITTEVAGEKIWLDENNSDRPDTITIELLANGTTTGKTVEISSVTNANYTFSEIPKYDKKGVEIAYTVQEKEVPKGYEATIEGTKVTNLRVGETEVTGEKVWKDEHETERTRPEAITVNLLRNGKFHDSKEIRPSGKNSWSYTFENLDEFDEKGIAYAYTVEEDQVPEGYTSTVEGSNIINVRIGKTEIAGTKTWKDGTEKDRPESITVNLLQNKVVVDTQEVTATDDWEYNFTELEKYDEDGKFYQYTVSEEYVPGYEAEINGTDISNTRSEKTSIEITKGWLDEDSKKRPKSVTVYLYQNDQLFKTVKLSAKKDWEHKITGLEAYDESGNAYDYTIKEKEVNGYETTINGFNITNLRKDQLDITGEKTWKDDATSKRPESIEVVLTREVNSKKDEEFNQVVKVTPNQNGKWFYIFGEVEEYDEKGQKYDYIIEEKEVPVGYESSVDGYDLTNLRVGTREVSILKKWENDTKVNRPKNIQVDLLRNGKVIQTVTLSERTGWKYKFTNLPAYDFEGKAYGYSVSEREVPGYEAKINSTDDAFEITNTYLRSDEDSKGTKPILPGKGGGEGTKLPKTGETTNIGLYLIGGLFVLAGLILGKRRIQK